MQYKKKISVAAYLIGSILASPVLAMEISSFEEKGLKSISLKQLNEAEKNYKQIKKQYEKDELFNSIVYSKELAIKTVVKKYLNDDEGFRDLMTSLFPENGKTNSDVLAQYTDAVQDFLYKGIPLSKTIKCNLLTYLLNDEYLKQIEKPGSEFYDNLKHIAPQLLDAHTRTHIDILHNLGLNGSGAALLVLESDFSCHPHINFLEGLSEEIFNESDSHGLKTMGVAIAEEGVARGAIGIPVDLCSPEWRQNVNSKYEQLIIQFEQELKESLEEIEKKYDVLFNNINPLNYESEKLSLLLQKTEETGTVQRSGHRKIIQLMEDNLEKRENLEKEKKRFDLLSDLKVKLELAHAQGISPRVINMSLSSSLFPESDKLEELTQLLEEHDLLLVNSAGNKGVSLTEMHGDFFNKHPQLLSRILFVGAIDPYGDFSCFSNFPGKNLSKHYMLAPGVKIKTLKYGQNNEYEFVDGTSLAAPFVSGTLVLLSKYFPNLDMITLKDIVLSTASHLPWFVEKKYKQEKNIGCGLLDAFKAFKKAKELSIKPSKKDKCAIM